VPDVYCDQFTIAQSAYGVAFTFSLTYGTPMVPGQAQSNPQAVVRMSLEHAKIMVMLVRRNLKQYELEHLGDAIKLPAGLYRELKLEEQDW
jgi:hypothetical protein